MMSRRDAAWALSCSPAAAFSSALAAACCVINSIWATERDFRVPSAWARLAEVTN
jgi:hypothetical protein